MVFGKRYHKCRVKISDNVHNIKNNNVLVTPKRFIDLKLPVIFMYYPPKVMEIIHEHWPNSFFTNHGFYTEI